MLLGGVGRLDFSGPRIEGYFDLAPVVRLPLRITEVVMVGFAILGVLLNVLDLTAGTHLTKDPDVGLVLSIVLVPFGIGFYFIGAKTRGEPCWIAGETSALQCAVQGAGPQGERPARELDRSTR